MSEYNIDIDNVKVTNTATRRKFGSPNAFSGPPRQQTQKQFGAPAKKFGSPADSKATTTTDHGEKHPGIKAPLGHQLSGRPGAPAVAALRTFGAPKASNPATAHHPVVDESAISSPSGPHLNKEDSDFNLNADDKLLIVRDNTSKSSPNKAPIHNALPKEESDYNMNQTDLPVYTREAAAKTHHISPPKPPENETNPREMSDFDIMSLKDTPVIVPDPQNTTSNSSTHQPKISREESDFDIKPGEIIEHDDEKLLAPNQPNHHTMKREESSFYMKDDSNFVVREVMPKNHGNPSRKPEQLEIDTKEGHNTNNETVMNVADLNSSDTQKPFATKYSRKDSEFSDTDELLLHSPAVTVHRSAAPKPKPEATQTRAFNFGGPRAFGGPKNFNKPKQSAQTESSPPESPPVSPVPTAAPDSVSDKASNLSPQTARIVKLTQAESIIKTFKDIQHQETAAISIADLQEAVEIMMNSNTVNIEVGAKGFSEIFPLSLAKHVNASNMEDSSSAVSLIIRCIALFVRFGVSNETVEIYSQKAAQHDACKLVVDVTNIYVSKPDIIVDACQLLIFLATNESNQTTLHSAGACDAFYEALAMHVEDPDVTKYTCFAIGSLTDNATNKTKLGQLGACEMLVQILLYHMATREVLEYACSAIALMARNDHPNTIMFGEAEGCETMMIVLSQYIESADLTKKAIKTITFMSMDDNNREKLAEFGAIELAARALALHLTNPDVVYYAAWAIAEFAFDNEDNHMKLLQSHASDIIARALAIHMKNEKSVDRICFAIAGLALHEYNRRRLGQVGVFNSVTKALKQNMHNPSVALYACWAIDHLAVDSEILIKLGDAGACEAVTEVFRTHMSRDRTIEYACNATASLSHLNENQVKLGEAGCCEQLVLALNTHPNGIEINIQAIYSIANLCETNSDNRKKLNKVGAMDAVSAARDRNPKIFEIKESSRYALSHLARSDGCCVIT